VGDPATWAANRRAALEKLREKKKMRCFEKKVRYESRRRLAESRPRIRGQFVKASALLALKDEGCIGS
jgi:pseudo-response regulator 7